MTVEEAQLVLNFKKDEQVTMDLINERFNDYFARNDVDPEKGGGSIYLQAKIKNARDALVKELGKGPS